MCMQAPPFDGTRLADGFHEAIRHLYDSNVLGSSPSFGLLNDHPLALPATEMQRGPAREPVAGTKYAHDSDFFMKAVRDMSGGS